MTHDHVKPLPVDPDVLSRIRPMASRDAAAVARLHHAAMGSSLWARLGIRFLEAVYGGLVEHPDFRGYVYEEDGRVKGFIAGSNHGPRMFRETALRHGLQIGLAALPAVLISPSIWASLAQSVLYFNRSGVAGVAEVEAESMFCSFEPSLRGRRISGLINKVLFDELAAQGHRYVKVTTDADNPLSARQLSTWGFDRMGTFRFYGKEMLAWRLDLTASPRVEAVSRFDTGINGGMAR